MVGRFPVRAAGMCAEGRCRQDGGSPALRGAAPVKIAHVEEIRTFAFSPAPGFRLVFDGERDMPPLEA